MTDNEIKENCLQEAGIDLCRYSYKELNEIKDALRRYHDAKLKLLSISDVSGRSELLIALYNIEKICDNQNTTHEQIWRIAHEAINSH
jgi:hypothetical protein